MVPLGTSGAGAFNGGVLGNGKAGSSKKRKKRRRSKQGASRPSGNPFAALGSPEADELEQEEAEAVPDDGTAAAETTIAISGTDAGAAAPNNGPQAPIPLLAVEGTVAHLQCNIVSRTDADEGHDIMVAQISKAW